MARFLKLEFLVQMRLSTPNTNKAITGFLSIEPPPPAKTAKCPQEKHQA